MSNYREQVGSLPSQFKAGGASIAWKHEEISIGENSLVTVHFDTTRPNMFMLQNPNNTVIHVGISRIPTAKNYEFKIESNSSATFGRPVPTDAIYLLNKGNAPVNVSLFSIYDKFEMGILQSLNVDLSKSPVFDGIINGFGNGVSIPSGTNNIGKVDIQEMPNVSLNPIPEGTNLIGKVENVYKPLNMLYSETVTESILVELSNRHINHIVFLANDSEDDVFIYLKKPDGNGCGINLKGGEKISDIPFEISSIRVTGDNVSFRYLVGER